MNLFDTRTVYMLCGIMGGLTGLVVYFLRRSYPPSIKGLSEWSGAFGLLFFAGVLTALRDHVPDWVSITMGNGLFYLGLYVSYVGAQKFVGLTPRPTPWLVFLSTMLLAHTAYTYVWPSLGARIIVVNLGASLFFLPQIRLMMRYRRDGFARWLTFGALVGACLTALIRAVLVVFIPAEGSILTQDPTQQIYAVAFAFSIMLYAIGVILLATDALREELELLATRDSLTGALTRRHWNQACAEEFKRCLRSGNSMAVLMLDLDHFKAVNDSLGHAAGDQVLVNFVTMVEGLLRENDRLGRYGGEEFILLLPDTSRDQALHVAERIRAQAQTVVESACTVSIGVAATLGETDSVESILLRADAAMYQAKALGRNRVESG